MATAQEVLEAIARFEPAMHVLDDSGAAVIEHVSKRNPDGPDTRVDSCPCSRGPETLPVGEDGETPVYADLGGGQYVSSARHTLGDVVRDLVG